MKYNATPINLVLKINGSKHLSVIFTHASKEHFTDFTFFNKTLNIAYMYLVNVIKTKLGVKAGQRVACPGFVTVIMRC